MKRTTWWATALTLWAATTQAAPPATLLPQPSPTAGAPAGAQTQTVIVRLREQAKVQEIAAGSRERRQQQVIATLQSVARTTRRSVTEVVKRRQADGSISRVTSFWVFNGLSVTGTPEAIAELARDPEVASITPDAISVVPTAVPAEPNLVALQVPALWDAGVQGQGVVIASLDTGVDVNHPELAGRFRGGTGSWFDPYGQHPTPVDLSGHGTWTMGVMVGGDLGGSSLGVAPGAQWIAAKIFNDQGSATATAIHLAFQWVLDPDRDPTTADAPDVVNNSWSFGAPGCNLEFQSDLLALRAAGLVAVFAAGNAGPGTSTSQSPANYPQAFSVGAVDQAGAIAWDSSRGPSACDGSVFPDVVAPGVGIATTELFSSYTAVSGTSISAPQVSGVFALLRQAFPAAQVSELEAALTGTATDLGPAGADNTFGAGLVNAQAASQRLVNPVGPTAPVALVDAYALAEDTAANVAAPGVLSNDSGPSALSAVLLQAPLHGALTLLSSGAFSYTPARNFNGVDQFEYAAVDGNGRSGPATVTLTVTPVNDAPTAVDDGVRFWRIAAFRISVLANDSDVDSAVAPGTVTVVTFPTKGSVSVGTDGVIVYSPRKGFSGQDSFTYRVADDRGAWSNVATVRLKR